MKYMKIWLKDGTLYDKVKVFTDFGDGTGIIQFKGRRKPVEISTESIFLKTE